MSRGWKRSLRAAWGWPAKRIARETGLALATVQAHVRAAAQRLPGAGSPRHRLLRYALMKVRPEAPP